MAYKYLYFTVGIVEGVERMSKNGVYQFQLVYPESDIWDRYTHIIETFTFGFFNTWIFEQLIEYNGFLTEV